METQADVLFARMYRAMQRNTGMHLSSDDVELLRCSLVGEWASEAHDKITEQRRAYKKDKEISND